MKNINANFIDAEDIIVDVKNKLSSYFDQGSIDDSLIYPVLLSCVAKFVTLREVKDAVFQLDGKPIKLPGDFHKIECMYGCNVETATVKDNPLLTKWEEREVCEIPICKTEWDYCKDECGFLYQIVQVREEYTTCFNNFFRVSLKNQDVMDCCNKIDEFDFTSKYEVFIDKGKLHANFCGNLYLSYTASLTNLEEGTIKIPDYPQITEWIKDKVITDLMEKMYLNGDNNVLQRLQYMQQRLTVSQLAMNSFISNLEVYNYENLRTALVNRKGSIRDLKRRY